MTPPYQILAAAWIGWCVLHSLLSSGPVIRSVERRPWRDHRYYRLFYNIFSLATLAPIVSRIGRLPLRRSSRNRILSGVRLIVRRKESSPTRMGEAASRSQTAGI